jgi:1-acyl-sn-glycerol-3-phosphate acyltransferase
MKKKKQKKWMKTRHRVVRNLAFCVLYPYSKWKYGITVEKFKEQGDRAHLILFNHQTAFDQFFVGMAFKGPVYYVASEDLFSMGWVSKLIRWVVAPIPIKKQTTDLNAVMNCIRIAREGGTIAIAPEGNRTFSGETVYMSDAIAPLAKKLKLPIALYRLEGGYGVQPRWSDVVRKGKMKGYVSKVIEPEEYAAMKNDELFSIIQQELSADEGRITGSFHHKKNAEFLERAMYVCPYCGLSTFESKGSIITCCKCGRAIRHNPDKTLEGVGFSFPHRFVADWYDAQSRFINDLDLSALGEFPVYTETAQLRKVIPYKRKKLLNKRAVIRLYGDRIEVGDRIFHFDDTAAVVVLGKNKLNIYFEKELLQLKGSKRFNALKYVQFFHRYQNIKGGKNDEFLGL